MGGELRKIEVWVTTRDVTQAPPLPDGRPAYSDDVIEALTDALRTAAVAWYEQGGNAYLKCEPDVM